MLCTVSWSANAGAAATVSVTPSGDAAYTVQGAGLDGVAGIQLDITYDAGSLSSPSITQGGVVAGALLAVNSTTPGLLKIAVVSSRPFSGAGQIASITFASKTGSGGIVSITTSMIDSNGAAVPASAVIAGGAAGSSPVQSNTPAVPAGQTTSAGQTTPAGSTSAATSPGTITLPVDQQQRTEVPPAPPAPPPAYKAEPEAAAVIERAPPPDRAATEAKPAETPQYIVYRGILDRFRQYRGIKNLPALAALFDKKIAQSIRQEPGLLVSNGRNRATLVVDIPARISASPKVEVSGAALLSFTRDTGIKGRWIAEVLPDAGSVRATVTVIAGAEEFEYPLTVTPPLKTALTFDEPGWIRFLAETGTEAAPLHDFNGDGVRDYIDEYIFVANYLAGKVK